MEIAIWGTKKEAKLLCEKMETLNNTRVRVFIDNNIKSQAEKICKKDVIAFEKLSNSVEMSELDTIIIAVRNGHSIYEILKQIRESGKKYKVGIIKMEWYDFYEFNKKKDIWDYILWIDEDKKLLPYLQIIINRRCNLNCKGCTHFANIYNNSKDCWQYEKIRLIEDMKIISQKTDVLRLRILGGEPFLYKDLADAVVEIRKLFPDSDIRIVTNGIPLLKCDRKVLRIIEQNNVGLDISPYKPTIKIKHDIYALLKKYDVKYCFEGIRLDKGVEKFTKNINVIGDSEAVKSWKICPHKQCISIFDSKLYKCPNEVFLNDFFKYFEIDKRINSDGLLVSEGLDINKYMEKMYRGCSEVCKFCSPDIIEFRWQQNVKPSIEDWNIK